MFDLLLLLQSFVGNVSNKVTVEVAKTTANMRAEIEEVQPHIKNKLSFTQDKYVLSSTENQSHSSIPFKNILNKDELFAWAKKWDEWIDIHG